MYVTSTFEKKIRDASREEADGRRGGRGKRMFIFIVLTSSFAKSSFFCVLKLYFAFL